jgi:hypothetical protein
MASNVSREKLLFYAAAGGLGGFAGWGVQESFAGIRSYLLRDAIQGLIVGLFICAFLASIEALSVSQWRQAGRGIRSGAIFGAIGGSFGFLIAELLFRILHGYVGRTLAWSLLGILVGLGVGWASGSAARKRNGALGGLIGGALGGFIYQALTVSFPQSFGRAIGFIVLGALIGFFIGLVGELLKRGWLMVIRSQSRNAREGREYPLTKPVMIIGRAEESDIGLFGDQAVLAHHAIIRREGRDFVVSPAGGGQVLINRRPVAGRQALRSGDRVEVGGTLFIFRERAQAAQS